MFNRISSKNKLSGNTSYPQDMTAQEHSIVETSTSSDNSTQIGKIIQQENMVTLDMVNAIHLLSKGVGVTYIFPSTVDMGKLLIDLICMAYSKSTS